MKFHAYLIFDGSCAEAFRFYAELLGGKLELMTYGESPAADQVPEAMRDQVIHAALTVGDELLMASDSPPAQYSKPAGTHVSITVESADDARRIFDALAEDAQVEMPFAATFWSPGFGMLVDRWGTPWMVNTAAESHATAGAQHEAAASR